MRKHELEYLNYHNRITDLFPVYENPIFIPKKHTICSYRKQNRLAKNRKKP